MTRETSVHCMIDGHIAVITMENPPANTWTEQSLAHLKQLVEKLDANPVIYALVITGAGDKFFSAGADLKLFASGDKSVATAMSRAFGDAFETLSAFRGVSIAAINGYAMGGGLEVALACDIRIAESQVKLALPEAKVGLLPCAGGTQNLTALVGEGWAKRIILCGEQIDAATAERIGLVEQVVEEGHSETTAKRLADQVAHQSPLAVAACKQLIQNTRSQTQADGLVKERELFVQLFDTEDQQEGVQAFLQKRPPEWKNR